MHFFSSANNVRRVISAHFTTNALIFNCPLENRSRIKLHALDSSVYWIKLEKCHFIAIYRSCINVRLSNPYNVNVCYWILLYLFLFNLSNESTNWTMNTMKKYCMLMLYLVPKACDGTQTMFHIGFQFIVHVKGFFFFFFLLILVKLGRK